MAFPGFPDVLREIATIVYNAAPWKHIPGPWVMKVTVQIAPSKYITRYASIMGVSDKTNRGIMIFDSCEDYNAYCTSKSQSSIPNHLVFLYDEGKKNRPQLIRISIVSGFPEQSAPTENDVIFCEAALTAVTSFISEAARLGGDGGEDGSATPDTPLSQWQVMARVMEGGNDMGSFPCKQTIPTSRGDRTVTVTLIPTMSNVSHLTTGGATTGNPVNPMSPNFRFCIVCRKTESDVRSSTGHGLLKCGACGSSTEKYCSQVCQRQDWRRHKLTCCAGTR